MKLVLNLSIKRWNLSSTVPKGKPFISYIQIVSIFFIFSFVFYLLFPGVKVRDMALKENKNIDLAIIYLNQIRIAYPYDIENWEKLLSMYLKKEDKKRAYELIIEMEKFPDKNIQNKSIYLKYSFLKNEYLSTLKIELKDELLNLQEKLIQLFRIDNDKLEQLYGDYLAFGLPHIAIKFAKQLYSNYYNQKDTVKAKKWLQEYYKQALATSDRASIAEYYNLAIKLFPENQSLKEKLAEYYLSFQDLDNAAQIYLDLLKNIDDNDKKIYVLKLVTIYQWQKKYETAATVLKEHEALFMKDNNDKKMLLKLYLSLGKLDYAKNFALKILGDGNNGR